MGNMGIVIYRDKWTPAFIADGGPFMRLGEGSSKVFEVLGETRCKKWIVARGSYGAPPRQRSARNGR